MAALAADFHGWGIVQGGGFRTQALAAGADTFFRGALGYRNTAGASKLSVVPVDADEFIGIVDEKKVVAAADELVWVWCSGIYYVEAAICDLVNIGKAISAEASSDNPNDMIVQTTAKPGAIGRLIMVKAGENAGYINLSDRGTAANA